jgi:hypothetical protein
VLKDGWFVPTHSCIAKQERLLLKEKWKDCASCSRSASSDGKDNDSTSVILSPFDENGEVSDKLPPVQQRSPCLEQHEKELCLALSTPGPQYLRFLEEYSFEILVRYQVEVDKIAKKGKPVFKAWSSSQSTLAENNNDDTEDDGKGGAIMFMNSALIRRSKIRKVTSPDFEWKVGTYAVRRFILKLDAFRKDLDEPLEPDTPRTNGSPNCDAEVEAREKIAIAGIWEKIQNALKIKKRKKRKLGFREIEDEKSGGGAAQERSEARGDGVRKGRGDARMWGLLWYYGISGVANCPDEEEGRLGWVEAREREKEKEQKTQKCVEVSFTFLVILGLGMERPDFCIGRNRNWERKGDDTHA